jgi:hypothetical protein
VLSLDKEGDAVPLSAGRPDRASPTQVTVEIDTGAASVVGEHDLARYAAGAAAVDRSGDPTILAAVDRLAPFLSAESAQGDVFRITRR